MKQKIIAWWSKLKTTIQFKIFKELFFWSLILFGYEILSNMITAKDTILNYIGFFFYLIWLTMAVNKLYNYYKQFNQTNK